MGYTAFSLFPKTVGATQPFHLSIRWQVLHNQPNGLMYLSPSGHKRKPAQRKKNNDGACCQLCVIRLTVTVTVTVIVIVIVIVTVR